MAKSFIKKINNEMYVFEKSLNQDGEQCYYIKCTRLGRPFFMIPKKSRWEIQHPENVDEDIRALQSLFSDTIIKNDK